MRAMVLEAVRTPLALRERRLPSPGPGQVRISVEACAVCRTDLHVVDGELPDPKLPVVPGHEVVGRVVERGPGAERFAIDERVGVPWLGYACGDCEACRSGHENLCPHARFTGYTLDGGYADELLAYDRFCVPIPESYEAIHAAPLLCAGAIGYRTLKAAGDPKRVGIYGFGAAAHLVAQLAREQGREIYAFTRSGDEAGQAFARSLGAVWAGSSEEPAPVPLDAALIFAPVGALVPLALKAVRPAGVVVCGGIHMSDIPSFPYALLWGERVLRSVANLTRADAEEFLHLAAKVPIRTEVHRFALDQANQALQALRVGAFEGAAVLIP